MSHPPGTVTRVVTRRLTAATASDQEMLNRVVMAMYRELKVWGRRCGYELIDQEGSIELDDYDVATGICRATVIAYLVPRTDGDWPSLHQAIREDAEALAELRRSPDASDPF